MMQSTLTLTLLALTGGLFQVTNAQIQTESIQIENDNPDFRVCGVNYTEVLDNCNTNPPCPTGDRCPVGYTCYQLNEKLCPPETSAPTTEPTTAPTTLPPAPAPAAAFKICAEGFSQAASLCFDSTAKDCATCNNVTEACFTVAPQLCTDGNIDAPTSPQTATPTAAPKPTATPTMSVAPTKAPTPNRFFCATNWDTVDESCTTATPCPNGQQDCASTDGMNCYQIQADECVGKTSPVVTGSSETEGSDAQLIDTPPASSPSATVSEKVKVCAKDLIEATFNCATKTPCISSASCASGEECIPVDSCDKSGTTGAPDQASQSTFATKAPVPSPTGDGEFTDSPAANTELTRSPSKEFVWTTRPPNGSNILHFNSVIHSCLVGLIVLGAALV